VDDYILGPVLGLLAGLFLPCSAPSFFFLFSFAFPN
jgi:hypothetical protein